MREDRRVKTETRGQGPVTVETETGALGREPRNVGLSSNSGSQKEVRKGPSRGVGKEPAPADTWIWGFREQMHFCCHEPHGLWCLVMAALESDPRREEGPAPLPAGPVAPCQPLPHCLPPVGLGPFPFKLSFRNVSCSPETPQRRRMARETPGDTESPTGDALPPGPLLLLVGQSMVWAWRWASRLTRVATRGDSRVASPHPAPSEWVDVSGLARSGQEQELGLESHVSRVRQGWMGLAWQEDACPQGGQPGAQSLISSTGHTAAPGQSAFRNQL